MTRQIQDLLEVEATDLEMDWKWEEKGSPCKAKLLA